MADTFTQIPNMRPSSEKLILGTCGFLRESIEDSIVTMTDLVFQNTRPDPIISFIQVRTNHLVKMAQIYVEEAAHRGEIIFLEERSLILELDTAIRNVYEKHTPNKRQLYRNGSDLFATSFTWFIKGSNDLRLRRENPSDSLYFHNIEDSLRPPEAQHKAGAKPTGNFLGRKDGLEDSPVLIFGASLMSSEDKILLWEQYKEHFNKRIDEKIANIGVGKVLFPMLVCIG